MNLSVNILLVMFFVLVTGSMGIAGVVPNTLNYQGILTDNTGQPVNGTKDIAISLYDAPTGGTVLWTESQTGILVKNGQLSVVLGNAQTNPLDPTKLTGETYVGIKVGADPEMVPRQKFTSVAYALKSGDGVPKGAIIMWSGTQVPTGWALCDGTNGTPDLRDRFVVGSGNLYVAGNTGGSININLSHSHTVNSHTHPGIDHMHSIVHDHYVSRINNGTYWSEWGTGLDTGGDFAGYTYGSQTNSNSGAADRNLTTGATAPGTNSQLSVTQDIRPPYYAIAFIMKLQ